MSVSSMRVEKLHAELFEKMQEEQRVFIEELKTKTPDEILEKAYEYIIREDILEEMSGLDLSEKQVKALLASQMPLADLYAKWEDTSTPHMDDIRDIIEKHSEEEAERLGIKEKRRDRDAR
ncbi:MAG: DUF3848 domain-containing protein [Clostridia bacterium]|nr:DUF3848 domain-containing protein [Clostridia bacterium]